MAKPVTVARQQYQRYSERAEKAKITWPIELSDKQLMSLLYPPVENKTSPPEPDMEYVFCEMKKKNVTLMLLWEEYKEKHPDGIMYTQFCERYRKFKKNNKISMHKEHKAGEEIEVDWAGDTMSYVEPNTGEIKVCIHLCCCSSGKCLSLCLCLWRYENHKLDRCSCKGI